MFLHDKRAVTVSKLLLVEDDNNLREIYQARLSAEGYEIVAAQNGEEALSVAKQARPDLIISDVMMPRISGFEMLDILRATPELASTKVIMLTALGQAEDQARAGKLGADKYLVKSQVTLEDIVNCAKDLLNGTTVIAPDATQPAAAASPSDTPVPTAAVTAVAPVAAVTEPEASVEPITPPSPTPEPPQADPVPAPTPATDTVTAGISTQAVDSTLPTNPSGAPVAPVVTPVADPDPITAPVAIVSPADSANTNLPPIVTHSSGMVQDSAPTTEATSSETSPAPTVAVPSTAAEQTTSQSSTPQSLASEEAAMESQIAAFANGPTPTSTPLAEPAATSADTTTASNEQTLNEAVQDLSDAVNEPPVPELPPSQKPLPADAVVNPEPSPTAAPDTTPVLEAPEEPVTTTPEASTIPVSEAPASVPPEAPAPEQSPEPSPQAEPASESDQVNVAGKKVIKPINDITRGPNLDELLAKEVEKEQASTGLAGAVVSEAPQPQAPATSTAPQPNAVTTPAPAGSTVTTPPTQTIDPNSIAL